MVTTVGTESSLKELVYDLVKLDNAAIEAYDSAIERLSNASFKEQLTRFRDDHVEHTRVLGAYAQQQGWDQPDGGGAKQMLTKGKVVLAGLMGDKSILTAMKTNEDDTNTAYERAVNHRDADGVRDVFARHLGDEQRHRAWIEATLSRL